MSEDILRVSLSTTLWKTNVIPVENVLLSVVYQLFLLNSRSLAPGFRKDCSD